MTESQRRVSIEKIQVRQRRYHVSDLSVVDGLQNDAVALILTEGGEFKLVGRSILAIFLSLEGRVLSLLFNRQRGYLRVFLS